MVQLEAVHQGTLDDLLREEAEDLQERRSDPYQREQLDLASTDEQHWEKGARRLKDGRSFGLGPYEVIRLIVVGPSMPATPQRRKIR